MIESRDLPPLPVGWIWTSVGEIYDIIGGGTPSTKISEYWEGDIPWITSADIHDLQDIRPRKRITKKAIENSATNLVPERSLIVATRVGLGKIGMTHTPICFSQDAQALIGSNSLIFPDYSLYYLSQAVQVFKYKHRGTTIAGVTKKQLSELSFALPPLPEQHRIVSKIEELFTRRDAGIVELKKVKAQLKRYRQAVLKNAFEGKLTEDWRAKHTGELEPASMLLERIKEERKKNAKGKYKELPPLDTSALPALPEGWVWTIFDIVCTKIQDGSHFSPETKYNTPGNGRYLYITAKNIKKDGLDLSTVEYVDQAFHRSIYERCDPIKEDVLLIKDGVKTGIAAINNLEEEFSLLSSVAILRSNKNILNPHYLRYFLNSPIGFNMITGKMTGTAIKRIILDKIRKSCLPIPPPSEQQKIVEEIERRFSVADAVEKVVDQNLKQAERLRQSILKRAFEGKLVPQDPTDEPASVLLEQIKAEREKRKIEVKPKPTMTKRKRDLEQKQTRFYDYV